MPVDIGGTDYYAYGAEPVEASGTDERIKGATIVVRDVAGNVLTPLHPTTQQPISPFQSSAVNGVTPSCLLPVRTASFDGGVGIPQFRDTKDLAGVIDALEAQVTDLQSAVDTLTAGAGALVVRNGLGEGLWFVRGDAGDPTDEDVADGDLLVVLQ